VTSERSEGSDVHPSRQDLLRQCGELQLIVDAIPAYVFYKDTRNRILRVNRAVADSFGVTAAELANTETSRWYPEEAEEHYQADLEVIGSGKPRLGSIEQMEVPALGKRWFETARLPQFDADGRVIGIVVVAQDLTDRRELEDRLLQAQKLESIGRLAGGVAHDFNNLLTSIFGLITVAQRNLPSDSMAHEYLALLRLAAEGGTNLTKQLLAFARRQIIEPQLSDLNALVLETSNLLERVLGENIDVIVDLSTRPLPVRVDPNQISQLLLNLALNARDAMPGGGRLTFTTADAKIDERTRQSLPAAGSGRCAVLTVRDTGHGLSNEAKEHLFEPFFTTKDFGKGTGLGLAMCYGIVKQNGGHIAVDSTPDRGTTFSIYLAQEDAPIEPLPQPRNTRPVPAGKETLLFVEDDDLLRQLAVMELSRHGYRLIEASNGEEALKAAREHTGAIHLLITDVIMPKMGGVELVQRFHENRPQVPVLYISGYAHDALADSNHGVQLLHKPFTNDGLLARVRSVLDAATSDS
jgi:two-component system, cell cycle sensor histidine kinase and response regulator CckA